MKGQLSIASRILVAFASGALIAVFFLPVWRIDLFAPQYPEGLSMYIWINNLTGQVDVINGLNHYIGMKHISVEMFPEFTFLPWVVGFFMLLGMIVAITGKRKFLLYYLGLSVAGGIAAIADFYKWGYDYGHDLNTDAPIQIPGFSYQPPIFGHKRILNFDAYSFPDVGGWIVVGAGCLATAVWLVEWWMQKKSRIKTKFITTVSAAASLSLIFISCSTKPQPIQWGKDVCDHCRMTIVDEKFGGEIVTKKGKAYKFDDLICMVKFLGAGKVKEEDIAQKLAVHFRKQNEFIDVTKGSFLYSDELRSPMGGNIAAFASKKEADQANSKGSGKIMTWSEYIEKSNN
jgi:copper chaperone NosL